MRGTDALSCVHHATAFWGVILVFTERKSSANLNPGGWGDCCDRLLLLLVAIRISILWSVQSNVDINLRPVLVLSLCLEILA